MRKCVVASKLQSNGITPARCNPLAPAVHVSAPPPPPPSAADGGGAGAPPPPVLVGAPTGSLRTPLLLSAGPELVAQRTDRSKSHCMFWVSAAYQMCIKDIDEVRAVVE